MSVKANNVNLNTFLPINDDIRSKIESGTLTKEELDQLLKTNDAALQSVFNDMNIKQNSISDFIATSSPIKSGNTATTLSKLAVEDGKEKLNQLSKTSNNVLGNVSSVTNNFQGTIKTEFPNNPNELNNIVQKTANGTLSTISKGINSASENVKKYSGVFGSAGSIGGNAGTIFGGKPDLDRTIPGINGNINIGGNNNGQIQKDITPGNYGSTSINDMAWEENPLSFYHNYTYKFKLVAVNEPFPNSYSEFQQKMQGNNSHVVIAETGATKYNITNVSIDNIVSPNFRIKSTESTNITIHITEPLGVSLLDSFANAAEVLQIKNLSKAHYYLQLSFIGYNEDGSIAKENIGLSQGSGSDRYNYGYILYRLAITNFEVSANFGGSNYVISARPQNEIAYNDLEFRFNDPEKFDIQSSGATVSQAFGKLSDELNKDIAKRYNGIQKNRYTIVSPNEEINSATFLEDNKEALKSTEIQGSKGETIEQMVFKLLSNSTLTEKYNSLAEGNEGEASKLTDVIKIYSEVKYTGEYSPMINDYLKEITYHVYLYKSARPIASFNHAETINNSNGNVGKKILSEIISKNFIRKKYSYIYTGENTEVLDIDIKFNFNYAALSYIYDGKIYSSTVPAQGQKYSEKAKDQMEQVGSNLDALQDMLENSYQRSQERTQDMTVDDIDFEAMDKERELILRREKIQNDLGRLRQEYEFHKNNRNPDYTDEDYEWHLQSVNQEIAKKAMELQNLELSIQQHKVSRGRYSTYAEDIPDSTYQSKIPLSIYANPLNTFAQYGTGHHGGKYTNKPVFTNILDQTYNNSEKELNRIVFSIRGDPYWIGNTSMDDVQLNGQMNSYTHANYLLSDNYTMIVFRYPFGTNNDGSLQFKGDDSIFNGIYTVTNVVNEFSNGVFTQSLTAIRENVMFDVKVL